MRLLINTSNLKKGGSLQVAYSFLNEIKHNTKHTFYVVLSSQLKEQIDIQEFPNNFIFKTYSIKPTLLKVITGRDKFLSKLEKDINPDKVFSIFSPAYWRPKSIHISGFANGWSVNPGSIAFAELSFLNRIKKHVISYLKLKLLKLESNIFIVETISVKEKLSKFGKIPINKIYVVSNNYGVHYVETFSINDFVLPQKSSVDEFRFITISSNYKHKNLKILKEVIPILRKKDVRVKFFITIPEKTFQKEYNDFKDYIINLKPVPVINGPAIYHQCDALFLPTLLECFSASYPEAMIMKKPILTSDLGFARDICKDAAIYFNPLDAKDVVSKIILLINNKNIYNELVALGLNRVKDFPTAKERAKKYIEICE